MWPWTQFYTPKGLILSDFWARWFRPATARYPTKLSQKTITMAKHRCLEKDSPHCGQIWNLLDYTWGKVVAFPTLLAWPVVIPTPIKWHHFSRKIWILSKDSFNWAWNWNSRTLFYPILGNDGYNFHEEAWNAYPYCKTGMATNTFFYVFLLFSDPGIKIRAH